MRKINNKAAAVYRFKLYLAFWAFLIVVFSAVIYTQIRKENGLAAEIETLTQQKEQALAEQKNYQQKSDMKASDKAVEDFGHDQGLVYPNEIQIRVETN